MKLPTENDAIGDPSHDHELDDLQRMVRENEEALKRANKMISELRKQLQRPGKSDTTRTRKKKSP